MDDHDPDAVIHSKCGWSEFFYLIIKHYIINEEAFRFVTAFRSTNFKF